MSKVQLQGNVSGTGIFTIASPNSNTDRTLTLPDNTGTLITQNSQPAFASTIGVGGATPAASGAGITFPAVKSPSSDANTLDDYEEGTWTPVLSSTGGAVTYTLNTTVARYTKIGDMVYFTISMQYSGKSGGSSAGTISLPFAVSATGGFWQGAITVGYFGGLSNANACSSGYSDPGRTDFFIRPANQSSGTLTIADFGASGHFIGGGFYKI